MNTQRIFFSLITFCIVSLSTLAQTAKSVLDQTADKLRNSGGIEAAFEGTQFKGTHVAGTANGKIQVQGNKFKIASNALTTWFDGTTQWTLLKGSNEVNVSTPTAAELQQINPYTFINLYKRGYNLTLKNATYQGKSCHEVRLTAQNKNNDIQLLIVTIDKQSNLPLSIRIKDKHKEWTRIRVSGIHTGKNWNDTTFRFNESEHPGIEVIDLR